MVGAVACVVTATACWLVILDVSELYKLLVVFAFELSSEYPGTIFTAWVCISFLSIVTLSVIVFPFSVCAGIFSPYASSYFVSGIEVLITTRIILKFDGGFFTVIFLE